MRRPALVVLVLTVLLAGAPAAARAGTAPPPVPAALAAIRTPGTAWGHDPATGRLTVAADDTVRGRELAVLRRTAARAGAVLRHEPGRLRPLIAGGQAVYGGGGRCSLGANVRSGTTWYFVTAGHCTRLAATWYADGAGTTVLGSRTGSSFPGNDYGVVRYTGTVAHPSAVYTHPGQVTVTAAGSAYVGQAVCRSGATTGVRCGSVTGLNATVNYAEGSVTGLIRTNICAEPGDSGGPLYVAATGTVLGVLSGGSGTCVSGGTSYYQPILEILAAYGLTIP
ncbi:MULTISPECIES: S1 family peptidase [unclassified Micromonospora]|uniref:S1 family peptidase n=1 Tax=unclassified Micromonospora TaxID=2617518 RepID=UPI0033E4B2D5